MTKAEAEAAYRAGCALPSVQWPEDATDEQRTPGPHHSPFAPDDPQHAEWLKGLRDALEAPKEHATILKEINDEIKAASHAR